MITKTDSVKFCMLPARVNFYYLYFKSLFSIFGLEKAKRHIEDADEFY